MALVSARHAHGVAVQFKEELTALWSLLFLFVVVMHGGMRFALETYGYC